ncbi:MAG TPA: HlyD family efflux transporter periplasmic adaptor subunit [Stellaceae bacterium]
MTTAAEVTAKRPRSPDLGGRSRPALLTRRAAKLACAALLLAAGLVSLYQQLVVRASRDAVINARVAVIRAPIDGIATATVTTPGMAIKTGEAIGRVEDPLADDARLAQLEREASAAELERDSLPRRLTDLERARGEAAAQAEAYRLGRVRQLELRIEEARANLDAAAAREADAKAVVGRGAALHARGFQSDEAQEKARYAQEVEDQAVIAARMRLDALAVELDAARTGTFLGDSYNDAPSSLQRARELALRITETQAALDEMTRKSQAVQSQLADERDRLAAHSKAVLTAPVEGQLWTVLAAPGEYVRKGQDLLTVLDCSTVIVTASVSDRDYNELHLGDPVRFRVSGTDREYAGRIVKLGGSTAFAIPFDPGSHQIVAAIPKLAASSEDGCAVGRTGEVIFEDVSHGLAARLIGSLRSLLRMS